MLEFIFILAQPFQVINPTDEITKTQRNRTQLMSHGDETSKPILPPLHSTSCHDSRVWAEPSDQTFLRDYLASLATI